MASGGSARPAPAARRTIPPTRSGSRHARRRSAVIIPIRPSTATWLPVSARRAALDPPSSPTSERRKANGHAGGSWRAGGVRVSAPTTERTARARAASTITKRASRRIAGRPTVGPSPERRGRWTERFSDASARIGSRSVIFNSRRRPYEVPTSPATVATFVTAITVPERASVITAASAQREKRRAAGRDGGADARPYAVSAPVAPGGAEQEGKREE